MNDATGEKLRELGHEFGATTGRPRRTGWLDLPALKYAIMISGVTELIMMKADILTGFKKIKVATGYVINGVKSDRVPFDTYASVKPVYKEFAGWSSDISKARSYRELPREFKEYIKFIESELGVPIKIISLGPDRNATIER